ncbi:MAG: SH3 domain-containing protein [Candidatus Omnitrophica bacterium]|nr:SH3 domain-containing protein [Candidatus Omnitrophota bacterium]
MKYGLAILLVLFSCKVCFPQQEESSSGWINSDNINVRVDSTVSAPVICSLNKGDQVEIVKRFFEWNKIRLPNSAPSFVKKDFISTSDAKTGFVTKDVVNIRLEPDESSPILGKTSKNQILNILSETKGWYKITPVNNSFGWVNEKFINKTPAPETKPPLAQASKEYFQTRGVVMPYGKVLKRSATHKLLTLDNKIFFLKGNKASLDALNYRKIKVIGLKIDTPKQKYPLIEITEMEALE